MSLGAWDGQGHARPQLSDKLLGKTGWASFFWNVSFPVEFELPWDMLGEENRSPALLRWVEESVEGSRWGMEGGMEGWHRHDHEVPKGSLKQEEQLLFHQLRSTLSSNIYSSGEKQTNKQWWKRAGIRLDFPRLTMARANLVPPRTYTILKAVFRLNCQLQLSVCTLSYPSTLSARCRTSVGDTW